MTRNEEIKARKFIRRAISRLANIQGRLLFAGVTHSSLDSGRCKIDLTIFIHDHHEHELALNILSSVVDESLEFSAEIMQQPCALHSIINAHIDIYDYSETLGLFKD